MTELMPVIKYQEFIPHTVLQDYVKRFWILEKEYTAEESVEDVTPDDRMGFRRGARARFSQRARFPRVLCARQAVLQQHSGNEALRIKADGLEKSLRAKGNA